MVEDRIDGLERERRLCDTFAKPSQQYRVGREHSTLAWLAHFSRRANGTYISSVRAKSTGHLQLPVATLSAGRGAVRPGFSECQHNNQRTESIPDAFSRRL